jgi:hypothetical protein
VNVVAASDLTVVATAAVTAAGTLAAALLTQAAVAKHEGRRSRLELAGRRRDEMRTVLDGSGSAPEEARAGSQAEEARAPAAPEQTARVGAHAKAATSRTAR